MDTKIWKVIYRFLGYLELIKNYSNIEGPQHTMCFKLCIYMFMVIVLIFWSCDQQYMSKGYCCMPTVLTTHI